MSSTREIRPVTVDGVTLRVRVRRAIGGSGIPLVIANGIGAPFEMLQPFVDALPAHIEVVRFDAPGVGGSALTKRPYRFSTLARMLRTALNKLGYGQVDLLGISWGGGLAQQFALNHKNRCRRLVLVSTATGACSVPGSPRVLKLMATPRRYKDPAFARQIAGTIYGGAMRDDPQLAARILAKPENRIGPSTGYWLQLFAITGWTSLPWLRRIRQPTLILAGDDDPIIPAINARIMAAMIPNAQLHVYHDGHIAMLTDADVYGPMVADFLSEPIRV